MAGPRQPEKMCHNLGFATAALTLDVDRLAAPVTFLFTFGLLLVSIVEIVTHIPFLYFDSKRSANFDDFIAVESEVSDD